MPQINAVKEELLQSDETFRSLYEEHLEYKQRLDAIRGKLMPSEADEIEIKRIKLHKLALKDRMEAMLVSHSRAQVPA